MKKKALLISVGRQRERKRGNEGEKERLHRLNFSLMKDTVSPGRAEIYVRLVWLRLQESTVNVCREMVCRCYSTVTLSRLISLALSYLYDEM